MRHKLVVSLLVNQMPQIFIPFRPRKRKQTRYERRRTKLVLKLYASQGTLPTLPRWSWKWLHTSRYTLLVMGRKISKSPWIAVSAFMTVAWSYPRSWKQQISGRWFGVLVCMSNEQRGEVCRRSHPSCWWDAGCGVPQRTRHHVGGHGQPGTWGGRGVLLTPSEGCLDGAYVPSPCYSVPWMEVWRYGEGAIRSPVNMIQSVRLIGFEFSWALERYYYGWIQQKWVVFYLWY